MIWHGIAGYDVSMQLTIVDKARIDKFLWATRFYKTRGLAAEDISKGRIKLGDSVAKASREVKAGDTIEILRDGLITVIEVLAVSEQRGPAALAQLLYSETAQSKENKEKARELRRFMHEPANAISQGRPTKRDRRALEQASGKSKDWNARWSAEI
jgi:ribosome-associated heat shock protein Hsp15